MTVDEICNWATAQYHLAIPPEVRDFVSRCLALDIAFDVMPNAKGGTPTGSDQAANVRSFLGHTGVPIQYESKSALYSASIQERKCYVIAVCRGDDWIDEKALRNHMHALNGGEIYDKVNTETEFGINLHGLINPFYRTLPAKDGVSYPVIHLWDEALVHMDPDFGVFTNASHPQWGAYYYPSQHPSIRENPTCVGRFVDQNRARFGFERRRVAIIGGILPQVTELMVKLTRGEIEKRLASYILNSAGRREAMTVLHAPEIVTDTRPVHSLSMLGPAEMSHTREVITRIVGEFCQQGAAIVAVPDNVLATFSNQIKEVCGHRNAMHLSMTEALENVLQSRRPEKLSVFTSSGATTPDTTAYQAICANENRAYAGNVIPLTDAEQRRCEELCLGIRKLDPKMKPLLDKLITAIRAHALRVYAESGTSKDLTVVLGHTGLSLLYQELRWLHENKLFSISPQRGCRITQDGIEIMKSPDVSADVVETKFTADMSVQIIDPLPLYATAIAEKAFPWTPVVTRKPTPAQPRMTH